MKTATWLLALALCATGTALAQTSGSRGTTTTSRPNSSNFGWQDRQREATEASDKYKQELSVMPEEQWKEAALAMTAFSTNGQGFTFDNAIRIGGASADRKSKSREIEGDESSAWVVEFGKKKPKVVTLTLTDRARTEVKCAAEDLLEAGEGYVGIFQTEFEIFCLARRGG